jgi:hypothetical protein
MDAETLRELIAAFQSLGGEAKEVFIWYMMLEYVPDFIIGSAWTAIGGVAIMKIANLLKSFMLSEQLLGDMGASFWTKDLIEECRRRVKGKSNA